MSEVATAPIQKSIAGRMVSKSAASTLPDPAPTPVVAVTTSAVPVSRLATTAPRPPVQPSASSNYADLQRLVDRSANFHLFTVPAASSGGTRTGSLRSIRIEQSLHPMLIDQRWPEGQSMKAVNAAGPECGRLDLTLSFVAPDTVAHPGQPVTAVDFDPGRATRFVVENANLRLGGRDSLQLFGAGRIFPMAQAGMRWLTLGAVLNVTSGQGVFAGVEGNCTLCGDLSLDGGLRAHLMVRLRDPQSRLTTSDPIPSFDPIPDPDPDATYLTWIGQKAPESRLANSASIGPAGLRGLNIPVDLKVVSTAWALAPGGIRVAQLRPTEVIGLEIGFGKEAAPRSPYTGTPNAPYQFEGVSKYTFRSRSGDIAGTLTANVLEGRSMNVNLEGAQGQPALRFGFFGPIIFGTGCFQGAQGMLYGASGSVFNPPPLDHVISNWYVLRLHDPEHKFRAGALNP